MVAKGPHAVPSAPGVALAETTATDTEELPSDKLAQLIKTMPHKE